MTSIYNCTPLRYGRRVLHYFQKPTLQKCLFLHIQKTAGTAVVDLARRFYGDKAVISHGAYVYPVSPHDQHVDSARCVASDSFDLIPFVSGHFGFGYAESLISQRFSFTFLRDPVERLVSFYYFCRSRNPEEYEIYALAGSHSMADFLSLALERGDMKSFLWNNQVWQIANGYGACNGRCIDDYSPSELLDTASRNLSHFSDIGLTEYFAEDAARIFGKLGIRLRSVPPRVNDNSARPQVADLPTSTRRLLHQMTELDQHLYDLALSMRNSR